MPDVLANRCRLCWGDGKCWFCRGAGDMRLLRSGQVSHKPCGECAPGSPGRCVRCQGSGVADDPKDAA